MLRDEFAQIHGKEPSSKAGTPLQDLHKDFHNDVPYRSALCLSGGGIRSAAFALGVIQYLSRKGLLDKFQYLSTVSGGGYVGSWLSAWIQNASKPQAGQRGGYGIVRDNLGGRENTDGEVREFERLRAYSNYLTPKLGLLSSDTWTATSITLRNLILNWAILIPFMAAVAMLAQIFGGVIGVLNKVPHWVPLAAIVVYLLSLVYINSGRPQWEIHRTYQGAFLSFGLFPALVAAMFWTVCMTIDKPMQANCGWVQQFFVDPLINLSVAADSHITAESCVKDIFPAPQSSFWPAFVNSISIQAPASTVIYIVALIFTSILSRTYRRPTVYVDGVRERFFNGVTHFDYRIRLSPRISSGVSVWVFAEDRQAIAGKHYRPQSANLQFKPGQGLRRFRVTLCPNAVIDGQPVSPDDIFIKFRDPQGVRLGGRVPLRLGEFIAYAVAGFTFGVLAALGRELYRALFDHDTLLSDLVLVTLAVPWLLISHVLAEIIFVGLTSRRERSDEEREWLGRAAGWFLIAATVWAFIAAVVLLLPVAIQVMASGMSPEFVEKYGKLLGSALLAAVGGSSGIATALLGGGPTTPALGGGQGSRLKAIGLYIAAPLFLISLAVALSFAVDEAAFQRATLLDALRNALTGGPPKCSAWCVPDRLFLIATGLVLVSVVVGCFVNVNRFSLHEIYRNRLVRAFLGASNRTDGSRDEFTDFNFADDMNMCRLWSRRAVSPPGSGSKELVGDDWRPFHVINMALNLAATKNLAWQERKAESFTASPLWCGCGAPHFNAFRRTSEYGGKSPITLGTAMAVSGAAVSPNMGYNSSPLVTFLLTLFNVRLGWWFGNPKKSTFPNEGPRWAVWQLLSELFGLTHDKKRYVYLSDGGHFDNLGLYEMVRRRCHFIVVSDAGQDADVALADLANATRKIAIDLGVRIEFPRLHCLRKRNDLRAKPDEGGPCFTVGRIRYSEADNVPKSRDGIILYIKPGFRGDEPADIVGYAAASPSFPHETTVDQWFTESQFESYRALGFTIMRRAHDAALGWHNRGVPKGSRIKRFDRTQDGLQKFFRSLQGWEESLSGESSPRLRQ